MTFVRQRNRLTTHFSERIPVVKRRTNVELCLRGGADKSLARPGRKQATATKLGIYSTYSPRNSMHFLPRCSNFCKPLKKKNSECCPSNFENFILASLQTKHLTKGDLWNEGHALTLTFSTGSVCLTPTVVARVKRDYRR